MKYIDGNDNIGQYKIVTYKNKAIKCESCGKSFYSGDKFYYLINHKEEDGQEQNEMSSYCKTCYKTHKTAEEL